jgi:hypothetical protein
MTNQYRGKTLAEYRRNYSDTNVILNLNQESCDLSASNWGLEHLIACRVIHKASGKKILPILNQYAPKSTRDLEHKKNWGNIKLLIDGLSQDNLLHKSRLELEQENGDLGTLWSALAKCVASNEVGDASNAVDAGDVDNAGIAVDAGNAVDAGDVDNAGNAGNARRNPKRKREPPQKYAPVPSKRTQTSASPQSESPSASQLSRSSYKPGSSNGGKVDEDEHINRTKPEILTVNLAGAFIRYVLNFCAEQKPTNKMLIEFREEPVQRVCRDLNHLKISATDDGGIWRVVTKGQGKHPWTWSNRLALLEAKKAFQRIDDDNRPEISDAQLAQYTCEALTACLDPKSENEYVYPSPLI